MITSSQREEILSDELTRPKYPGVRVFSPGILRLCRKLRLSEFTPGIDAGTRSPDAIAREEAAVAWLMDERHTLPQIHGAASRGDEFLKSEELGSYEFRIDLSFLMYVKAELESAKRAVDAVQFEIAPKPGEKAGPTPPGNS